MKNPFRRRTPYLEATVLSPWTPPPRDLIVHYQDEQVDQLIASYRVLDILSREKYQTAFYSTLLLLPLYEEWEPLTMADHDALVPCQLWTCKPACSHRQYLETLEQRRQNSFVKIT